MTFIFLLSTACDLNCFSCTYSSLKGVICDKCISYAFLSKQSSIPECIICKDKIPGCNECSNEYTCTKCFDDYRLTSGNQCQMCSELASQCTNCSETSGTFKCTKCKEGYSLFSNKCIQCPRDCAVCEKTSETIKCTQCKSFYSTISLRTCQICPDHCKNCELVGAVLSCKADHCSAGYVNNPASGSPLCVKCPDNCRSCTFNSIIKKSQCIGTSMNNQCGEKGTGEGWTVRVDGNCVGKTSIFVRYQ